MIEKAEILRSYIDKNAGAEEKTQLFQGQLLEDEDSQTIEEMHIPGVQYSPPAGSDSFFGRIFSSFKIALGIDDKVPKLETLNPGERIAYASKDGVIVCSILYKDDGTIQIDTDKDLIANVDGNFTATVASGKKISIGNGTDEILDLLDKILIELQKPVDNPGSASTGSLILINPALALIQTALGNIKV